MSAGPRALPPHAAFLGAALACGLAVLSLLRALFAFLAREGAAGVPAGAIATALGIGVRFDASVSAYLLGGPLLLLSALAIAGVRSRAVERIATWGLGLGYASAFLVAAADIPYYLRFGSRLTAAALAWADTPRFFLESSVGDPAHWPYLALFVTTSAGFGLLLGRLRRRFLDGTRPPSRAKAALASVVALALLFLAGRGRIARSSPIRTGTAFFSPYPFANQLGLNPAFTFWNSVLEARTEREGRVPLMPSAEAVAAARRSLGLTGEPRFVSPVARIATPPGPPRDWNVVLVLMEGMAAGHLSRHGGSGLTPRLDDLAARGHSFDRVYASGIHTFSGVYATLFSLPTLPGEHPMKGARALRRFSGLARVLSERGYRAVFLCPHDAEIDNMGGFLRSNGHGRIVDLDHWPEDLVTPNLRIADHRLFDLALPLLRDLSGQGKPFLATMLTVSNHPVYYLPAGIPFRPRSDDPALRMVEYADWSLGRFVDLASREPWFDRTLFVLVADHGAPGEGRARTAAAAHHVPLILYAPGLLGPPRASNAIGTQADVGPTVLGLLGRSWANTTLGVDLLGESRPAAVFCDDEAVYAFDGERLFSRRRDGAESFATVPGGAGLHPATDPRAAALREYALSTLETARVLVERNLAGPQPLDTAGEWRSTPPPGAAEASQGASP